MQLKHWLGALVGLGLLAAVPQVVVAQDLDPACLNAGIETWEDCDAYLGGGAPAQDFSGGDEVFEDEAPAPDDGAFSDEGGFDEAPIDGSNFDDGGFADDSGGFDEAPADDGGFGDDGGFAEDGGLADDGGFDTAPVDESFGEDTFADDQQNAEDFDSGDTFADDQGFAEDEGFSDDEGFVDDTGSGEDAAPLFDGDDSGFGDDGGFADDEGFADEGGFDAAPLDESFGEDAFSDDQQNAEEFDSGDTFADDQGFAEDEGFSEDEGFVDEAGGDEDSAPVFDGSDDSGLGTDPSEDGTFAADDFAPADDGSFDDEGFGEDDAFGGEDTAPPDDGSFDDGSFEDDGVTDEDAAPTDDGTFGDGGFEDETFGGEDAVPVDDENFGADEGFGDEGGFDGGSFEDAAPTAADESFDPSEDPFVIDDEAPDSGFGLEDEAPGSDGPVVDDEGFAEPEFNDDGEAVENVGELPDGLSEEDVAPLFDSAKEDDEFVGVAPEDFAPVPDSDDDAQVFEAPVEFQSADFAPGQALDYEPTFDAPQNVTIINQTNNTYIYEYNNQTFIADPFADRERLILDGDDSYYEQLSDGTYRETVYRPDGSRVVTIRDSYGNIWQRSRIESDGTEYYLAYYDWRTYGDENLFFRDPAEGLPPLVFNVNFGPYILYYDDADEDAIYTFFRQPPVEQVRRLYTIDEVKRSARIRDTVRRLEIGSLNFASGKATVAKSQVPLLQRLADAIKSMLRQNPAETFLIEGHTDAVGSDLLNLKLSDARAVTVAQVLTQYFGIPPENLVTQGYGERYLKIQTPYAEVQNRRVTVRRITPLITPVG